MHTHKYRWLWLLIAPSLLAGCLAGLPGIGRKAESPTPPPGPQQTSQAPRDDSYTLDAQAVGSCITFTLTNHREDEMELSPFHFAYIPEGTRRVVPYNPEIATIDLPKVVGPGQSVKGRAVFKEFPAPGGGRLVFKPTHGATFCVIKRSRL